MCALLPHIDTVRAKTYFEVRKENAYEHTKLGETGGRTKGKEDNENPDEMHRMW